MHRAPTVAGLVLALFAGTVSASSDPTADQRPPNLRPLHQEAAQLLQRGVARSPTIAALVADLEKTDLVVYLNTNAFLPVRTAETLFVTAAAGRRYVLVSVNPRNIYTDMIRWLGHELQHADEVAHAPEVTDVASFEAFYQRIGTHGKADHRFETRAAQTVDRVVGEELNGRRTGYGAGGLL